MHSHDRAETGRVPDFGPCVERRRLLDVFSGGVPRLVVLAAPGGHGKSILAAQVAALPVFDDRLWFDAGGLELDGADLLRGLCRLCEPRSGDATESLSDDASLPALLGRMESAMARHRGRRLCLVVDNIALGERVPEFTLLCDAVSRGTCAPASVLVTTRATLERASSTQPEGWVLEAEDLRLGTPEAEEIVARLQGGACDPADVPALLEASGGHVALFCLLARHVATRSVGQVLGGEAPAELNGRLLDLASQHFDGRERSVLHVAALLGHGSEAELARVVGSDVHGVIDRLADCLPLLRRGADENGSPTFRLHDIARGVFADPNFGETDGDWTESLPDRVFECLDARDECESVVSLLVSRRDGPRLIAWLEKRGERLYDKGATGLLLVALESVPPTELIVRPPLVLLQAQVNKRVLQMRDALGKARLAAQLAEHDGDSRTHVRALMLVARLIMNTDPREAKEALERILASHSGRLDPDSDALLHVLLVAVEVNLGEAREAFRHLEMAKSLVSAGATCVLLQRGEAVALIEGVGDMWAGLAVLTTQRRSHQLPVDEQIACFSGLAQSLCELGRLSRADDSCRRARELCDSHRSHEFQCDCDVISTYVLAGRGDYAAAEAVSESIVSAPREGLDAFEVAGPYLVRSVWRRAAGDVEGAVNDAEFVFETLGDKSPVGLRREARLELAACMLALGDSTVAVRQAEATRAELEASGDAFRLLRADLILTEADRQRGDLDAAVARMAAQSDYIRSENGNWQTAMYIRAFPGLLGVIAAAVGAQNITAHLLKMVLPENAAVALPMARDILPATEFRALASRLVDADEVERLLAPEAGAECFVRLLGGLQVVTPTGPVADAAWKKRKARLLFAMLACRKGMEVHREQLLEYLWPEMEEPRARSNFYVVWNNMKHALTPDIGKGEPSPYVHSTGGLCGVDGILVTTDVDEFEHTLEVMREAQRLGEDAAALASASHLAELYRGDLLAGDLYEDWFAPLRERLRHDFSDAMLVAAQTADASGDPAAALRFLRAAIAHDPWREDLYQVALRMQIATGQRSAAVETYMKCMRTLADELGLDPSVETRRLYDQVLAMEDSGAWMEPGKDSDSPG